MSLFDSKETTYSKVEDDVNPPAYIQVATETHDSDEQPATTHQSRFSEPIYFVTEHIHRCHFNANLRPVVEPNYRKPAKDYCKLLANISLIVGIALLLISVIFKIQSRSCITQAVNTGCPANCVTTCYKSLPFIELSIDCDSNVKQMCDEQCMSVGVDQASTFAILFYVFLGLGALLVAIQIVSNFLRYCCFDYIEYKRKNQVGDISAKV